MVVGHTVTREAVSATLELEARAGATLADPVRTLDGLGPAFASYFGQSGSFGGLFRLRAPVSWTGAPNGVAAVRVRIRNGAGESEPAAAVVP